MNKKELIVTIIDLIDENEKLKRENEILMKSETRDELTKIQKKILVASQSTVLDKLFRGWEDKVSRNENDDGVIIYTTYESWLKKVVDNSPNNISYYDFVSYFDEELRKRYSKIKEYEGE
ncbi:MAG TPA: hypothetical protein PLI61_13850 [bacterium]|jgi:hypothetical protein|nr:hypothetical protein [bacterium]